MTVVERCTIQPSRATERRVLIVAPSGRDAETLAQLLQSDGIAAEPCATVEQLCAQINRGAAAAIVAEEAFSEGERRLLSETLSLQPEWSDFPLIVMTTGGEQHRRVNLLMKAVSESAKTIVLQRPTHRITLLSAARSAIQSRSRQYQVRNELARRRTVEHELRANQARLQSAFRITTVGVIFWSSDIRIVDVNDAFLELCDLTREQAIGKSWQELTPPEFHDVSHNAVAELEKYGEISPYEKQYYRQDGSRWWGLFAARRISETEAVEYVLDITDRKKAEHALRESEERLRLAAEATGFGTYDYDVQRDEAIWSDQLRAMVGLAGPEPVRNEQMAQLVHPDDRQQFAELHQQALDPRGCGRHEAEYRIIRPDGATRWMRDVGQTWCEGEGDQRRAVRVLGTIEDITERKQHEQQMRFVMAELNHRVKNTLAVVESTASQTFRHTGDFETFREAFSERLRCLAKAHALLSRTQWEGAELRTLLEAELEHRAQSPEQFQLDGPPLMLMPDPAMSLHMALHELSTNATKYGALSTPNGRVLVQWTLRDDDHDPQLELQWIEQGGPRVAPPQRTGFGSKVLTQVIGHDLDGTTDTEYPAEGIRCTIRIPWNASIGFRSDPQADGSNLKTES